MSDYYRINISIFMKIVVQGSNWTLQQTQSGRLWYKVQTGRYSRHNLEDCGTRFKLDATADTIWKIVVQGSNWTLARESSFSFLGL